MNRVFKKTFNFLKLILIALCLTGCSATIGNTAVNENDSALVASEIARTSTEITASVAPAIYTDGEEPTDVSFEFDAGEDGSVKLLYTTNYSEPTKDSNEYEVGTPITIKYADTKDGSTKQAVIRCALFKDGKMVSEVSNFVYMSAPEGRFELPVYSIFSKKSNFYSNETGILVGGKLAAVGNPPGWKPWYSNANYYGRGIEWERPIGFTVFSPTGNLEFNTNCGIRVSGGYTRVNKQKSLRLYARKTYTPNTGVMEYSFWSGRRGTHTGTPVSFSDTILLRGGSNNEGSSIFNTPSLLMLLEGTDLDRPAITPVIEYINGIYYGIVMQLEDYDVDFFLHNYGVEEEYLSTIKGTAPELLRTTGWYLDDGPEGEEQELKDALTYIFKQDMRDPECYEKAKEMIDIQNFIEYMAFEAYIGNSDWPDNNLRAWRYNKDGYNPDGEGVFDGRWRFLTKDLDLSFGSGHDVSQNPYAVLKGGSALMLKNAYYSLMSNEEFSDLFYNFMCTLSEAVVSPERCEHIFDLMQVYTAKETAISISTCGVGGGSRGSWNWGFDVLRNYAVSRASNVSKYTKSAAEGKYGDVTVSYEGEGEVRIGWFDTENGETRKYLQNRRIPLEITPAHGYEIGNIEYENCEMSEDGYLITTKSSASVKVTFVSAEVEVEETSVVINEVMFRGTDYKWIELYNTTDEPITLTDWSLGKKDNPAKAVAIDNVTIEPESFVLICCTDYSNTLGIEGLSTTLSIGNDDELYLFDASDVIVDHITLSTPSKTIHLGRYPDGEGVVQLSRDEATPGTANFMEEDTSTFGTEYFKPYLLIKGRAHELDECFYEKDGVLYVNNEALMQTISDQNDCKDIYRYLKKQKSDVTIDALVEDSSYNEGASVRYLPELKSVIIG